MNELIILREMTVIIPDTFYLLTDDLFIQCNKNVTISYYISIHIEWINRMSWLLGKALKYALRR